MNRLTRRKTSGAAELIMPVSAGKNPVTRSAYRQIGINKLAAYENAEESGRLVELPCKVGDTVFFIKAAFTFLPEPCAGMVRSITLTEKEILLRTPDRTFGIDKIGKTVFLTREEAETALKGAEE